MWCQEGMTDMHDGVSFIAFHLTTGCRKPAGQRRAGFDKRLPD